MTWRYRIVRSLEPSLEGFPSEIMYSIREVYESPVNSWSAEPSAPHGDSLEDLADDFARMLRAFGQPILREDGDKLVPVEEK